MFAVNGVWALEDIFIRLFVSVLVLTAVSFRGNSSSGLAREDSTNWDGEEMHDGRGDFWKCGV